MANQAYQAFANASQALFAELSAKHQVRRLKVKDKQERCDLTHNDYLGLREDRDFQQKLRQSLSELPPGAGASRLLGGEWPIYQELEAAFALWKGGESALFLSSGYAANEALLTSLARLGAWFFSDEWNHASLIDAMKLARDPSVQKFIFSHNSLTELRQLLQQNPHPLRCIVVESLYSMDGDFCPASSLLELAEEFSCLLLVDEAHAVGVYGPEGRGYFGDYDKNHSRHISINPCGKALASSGAVIVGPAFLRELLINSARSFIYSTGPSPWMAQSVLQAIARLKAANHQRQTLHRQSQALRQTLTEQGWDLGEAQSHILPLKLGSEERALAAETFCLQRGLLLRAIRPPTVAQGACRLRLSLHAGLKPQDWEFIAKTMKELSHALA